MTRPGRNEEMARALGHSIRVLRTDQGLNRKELAEASGVSYPYLSEIEAGKKEPSYKVLVAIGGVLGVSPSEFMAEAESRVRRSDGFWSRRMEERDLAAPDLEEPPDFDEPPEEMHLARASGVPARLSSPQKPTRVRAMESARSNISSSESPDERASLEREVLYLTRTLSTEDLVRLVDLGHRLKRDRP
jgi:transcriptional regulator with XRE-family HTH domain